MGYTSDLSMEQNHAIAAAGKPGALDILYQAFFAAAETALAKPKKGNGQEDAEQLQRPERPGRWAMMHEVATTIVRGTHRNGRSFLDDRVDAHGNSALHLLVQLARKHPEFMELARYAVTQLPKEQVTQLLQVTDAQGRDVLCAASDDTRTFLESAIAYSAAISR